MSRLFAQFPQLYRFAALLALWSILTPALTMLVHHPKVESFPKAMSNCAMDMGQDTARQKNKNTPQKLPSCPICTGLHILGGGVVPPKAVIFPMPAVPVAIYTVVCIVYSIVDPTTQQARPRAPPA